jgi:arabinan endo-1,5-alpha-L-arabinosidase
VKQGNTYYLFATGGFGFSTSKDKLSWTRGGNGLSGMPAWTQTLGLSGAPSIWACDAHLAGGKALVYYAVSSWGDVTHSAIGLMTNSSFDPSSPGYKWVDQGKVVGSPEGGAGVNVIDPDLFVDDDGSSWLVYGSHHSGIRLLELNPQTGLAKSTPPNPVTLTTTKTIEGSSLIKAYGYYYLFGSAGTCCAGLKSTYSVVYGRASKVTGPYLNRNGQNVNTSYETLLAAGQDGNPGQGGQSFFKENGQWYMDYHAYQPPSGDSVLNVRPVYFDDAGWPTFDICKAKGYTK